MAGTLTPWPGLPPAVHVRRAVTPPYPLDGRARVHLHSRARSGLAAGLRALGVGRGSTVLMPSWHHGSEVEATQSTGAQCRFYEVAEDGGPAADSLDALVTDDVAALHLTHLLGFPQDAAAWRRWCDQRGLLLIEDAAQAWTASRAGVPVGSHGDLAVWCLYKTVGVPDGAAVRCAAPIDPPTRVPAAGALTRVLRRHAAWAAQAVPAGNPQPPPPYDPVRDMAMTSPVAASSATNWALPRLRYDEVPSGRRRNYLAWAQALSPAPGFQTLPDGAVPMVFPVAVDDKDAALAELRAVGIRGLDLWRVPHPSCPPGSFPRVDWLRTHVLGLPVHQEIGPRLLRRVVEAAKPVLVRRSCSSS